jgi:hypothetical protein
MCWLHTVFVVLVAWINTAVLSTRLLRVNVNSTADAPLADVAVVHTPVSRDSAMPGIVRPVKRKISIVLRCADKPMETLRKVQSLLPALRLSPPPLPRAPYQRHQHHSSHSNKHQQQQAHLHPLLRPLLLLWNPWLRSAFWTTHNMNSSLNNNNHKNNTMKTVRLPEFALPSLVCPHRDSVSRKWLNSSELDHLASRSDSCAHYMSDFGMLLLFVSLHSLQQQAVLRRSCHNLLKCVSHVRGVRPMLPHILGQL